MKYRVQDGEVLEATSLRHLAELLWHTQFMPVPSLEAWMRGSAERVAKYNGTVIRTSSPEDHITDLIAAGFITPLS